SRQTWRASECHTLDRSRVYPSRLLFVTQRSQRIDVRGPPRWDVTCEERDSAEHESHSEQRNWIRGGNSVKLAGEKAGQNKSTDNSSGPADHRQQHGLANNELKNVRGLRSQRHPNSNFMGALGNGIGDHAVESQRGQCERQACKNGKQ